MKSPPPPPLTRNRSAFNAPRWMAAALRTTEEKEGRPGFLRRSPGCRRRRLQAGPVEGPCAFCSCCAAAAASTIFATLAFECTARRFEFSLSKSSAIASSSPASPFFPPTFAFTTVELSHLGQRAVKGRR